MSGQGKYTTYVPVSSTRNTLLRKLFNAKASNEAGVFYGELDQANNALAASAAVKTATAPVVNGIGGLLPKSGKQTGDLLMFPEGVKLSYGDAPDISAVAWKNPGDPANPYVPDITSPGPGKTDPLDKAENPKIGYTDLKPNYKPGTDADSTTLRIEGTGTTSPSVTSPSISSPIGGLTMGKSSV